MAIPPCRHPTDGVPVEIRLDPGQCIAGRVVDEDGIGIENAYVSLFLDEDLKKVVLK